ncbi:3-phosphoshikimate 1-carboxyvinyltransferase [Methanomicrobium sp. W14]|uniref:3-phosphoshikimate 1-carboxyvinyltransferase n=1 Tax=Methanomicrobium sp. W14 TaxID=2817839 RepID=UPI001AE62C54|nr:3-phosphoshikimate 1-carboxyvinyltransferase [Methanomicrobium sp. W14]MBP2134109.1 3-phosphoshikimate 1-carboxyvinyltransferase [Methanomicrobium sp. W14]
MDINIAKKKNVSAEFTAPPSKSYTHRALIAAALAQGTSVIRKPLVADDIDVTTEALKKLGIEIMQCNECVIVKGCGGVLPDMGDVTIDCRNSGTSLRLLATFALLSPSKITLTGSERMKQRPAKGLCDALKQAGADIKFLGMTGYPPFRISGELRGGRIIIDASKSSQFVSSVMLCSPYADSPVDIMPKGSVVSRSYVDITTDIMRKFGANVYLTPDRTWHVSQSVYNATDYTIEGDYSSASYFFAIAPVCGGKIKVNNLNTESVQGDRAFLIALHDMGCKISKGKNSVTVKCDGGIKGVAADMTSCPDTVQTLCAVAAFASTKTVINGISHLKYKESDRIDAIEDMVVKSGCGFEAGENSISITPGEVHGFAADPNDDHRTAMSSAIIGLGTGGVTVKGSECVSKSFPGFWDELRRAGLLEE